MHDIFQEITLPDHTPSLELQRINAGLFVLNHYATRDFANFRGAVDALRAKDACETLAAQWPELKKAVKATQHFNQQRDLTQHIQSKGYRQIATVSLLDAYVSEAVNDFLAAEGEIEKNRHANRIHHRIEKVLGLSAEDNAALMELQSNCKRILGSVGRQTAAPEGVLAGVFQYFKRTSAPFEGVALSSNDKPREEAAWQRVERRYQARQERLVNFEQTGLLATLPPRLMASFVMDFEAFIAEVEMSLENLSREEKPVVEARLSQIKYFRTQVAAVLQMHLNSETRITQDDTQASMAGSWTLVPGTIQQHMLYGLVASIQMTHDLPSSNASQHLDSPARSLMLTRDNATTLSLRDIFTAYVTRHQALDMSLGDWNADESWDQGSSLGITVVPVDGVPSIEGEVGEPDVPGSVCAEPSDSQVGSLFLTPGREHAVDMSFVLLSQAPEDFDESTEPRGEDETPRSVLTDSFIIVGRPTDKPSLVSHADGGGTNVPVTVGSVVYDFHATGRRADVLLPKPDEERAAHAHKDVIPFDKMCGDIQPPRTGPQKVFDYFTARWGRLLGGALLTAAASVLVLKFVVILAVTSTVIAAMCAAAAVISLPVIMAVDGIVGAVKSNRQFNQHQDFRNAIGAKLSDADENPFGQNVGDDSGVDYSVTQSIKLMEAETFSAG